LLAVFITDIHSMGLKDAQQKNFEILVHTTRKASGHPMLGWKKPSFRLGTVSFGH
jgi:hypothetical protein